ncbi:hypothetical protein MRX96_022682 [Rhipicephalus microplus]
MDHEVGSVPRLNISLRRVCSRPWNGFSSPSAGSKCSTMTRLSSSTDTLRSLKAPPRNLGNFTVPQAEPSRLFGVGVMDDLLEVFHGVEVPTGEVAVVKALVNLAGG